MNTYCRTSTILSLCVLAIGCGDKDETPSDTESSEDSGTPAGSCPSPALPEVLSSEAFAFSDGAKYTGYAAAATSSGAVVGDATRGLAALIPWDASGGAVEDVAAWVLEEPGASVDLITSSGGWLGVADGAWAYVEEGEVPAMNAGTLRGIELDRVGELTSSDFTSESGPWAWTIRGEYEDGYVGSMFVGDLDFDGEDDVLTSSGPLPGQVAVWSDVSTLSGEVPWSSADVQFTACWGDGRNIFAPTSFAVFGDGWLAVGCPGVGHGGSQVAVYALPLSDGQEPAVVLGPTSESPDEDGFAGWWVASAGPGYPLYADNRRDGELVMIVEDPAAPGTFVETRYESPDGLGNRFGASPSVYVDPETGCGLLAVGDQSAEPKEGEVTGAVYLASLDESGVPVEWVSLDLPSGGEGISPADVGALVRLSDDGRNLVVTGWEWGSYVGGYVATWSLGPLSE